MGGRETSSRLAVGWMPGGLSGETHRCITEGRGTLAVGGMQYTMALAEAG